MEEAKKDKIIRRFLWFIGGIEDTDSFGDFKSLTEEKIKNLKEVNKVFEIEEMFTDKELDTEWINVEGVDYGLMWVKHDSKGDAIKELTDYFKEILECVESEEGMYYTEGVIGGNKCIILTGLEDEDMEELTHYKVVYS